MVLSAIDYMGFLHSTPHHRYTCLHLGDHSPLDYALGHQPAEVRSRELGDDARRIIRIHAHSFHIGDGEELLRPHGYSYCSRSGVGIDIEVISLIIGGNGGYNRDVALSCHDHQDLRVHLLHVSHKSQVHRLLSLHHLQSFLLGLQEHAVLAG
ncbi:MAG: hypothetical protein A4E43_01171 [Methanosaeta sp. PtaB.Bin005]|nr:MAG: hypothetical protein A4E43_01171 [Methanosaeta sp. PtaB.Bin005]